MSLDLSVAAAPSADLHLDAAALLVMGVASLLGLLVTVVGAMLRRLLSASDARAEATQAAIGKLGEDLGKQIRDVSTSVDGLTSEMQTVKHVLFGVDGSNGMRSELKRTTSLVVHHDRVLERMAGRLGVRVERTVDEEVA